MSMGEWYMKLGTDLGTMYVLHNSLQMVTEWGMPRRAPGHVGLHLVPSLDAHPIGLLMLWRPSPACPPWSALHTYPHPQPPASVTISNFCAAV